MSMNPEPAKPISAAEFIAVAGRINPDVPEHVLDQAYATIGIWELPPTTPMMALSRVRSALMQVGFNEVWSQ